MKWISSYSKEFYLNLLNSGAKTDAESDNNVDMMYKFLTIYWYNPPISSRTTPQEKTSVIY